jgi:hypothetical protein
MEKNILGLMEWLKWLVKCLLSESEALSPEFKLQYFKTKAKTKNHRSISRMGQQVQRLAMERVFHVLGAERKRTQM